MHLKHWTGFWPWVHLFFRKGFRLQKLGTSLGEAGSWARTSWRTRTAIKAATRTAVVFIVEW